MKVQNQWQRLFIGGAAAVALAAGTFWAVQNVSAASVATAWATDFTQQVAEFGGRGGRGGHGQDGAMGMRGGLFGDQQPYLADALGITVDELDAANESVRNTIIDQAVANGTLTQEQADQFKAGERLQMPGLRTKGGLDQLGDVDRDALLADALGITVEALDAARTAARDAAIAEALANGTITQTEVDQMAARQALHAYLHEQYADERPSLSIKELIQEALTAGALTEEQADLLLSNPGGRDGVRGGKDHGMRGGEDHGMRGDRGHGMRGPSMNDAQPQDENAPIAPQQNRNNDTQESTSDSNL